MAEALKKRMVEGGIDLFVANEPSFSVYRGDFTQRMNFGLVNSGMLIFRKSPITDRFFACAEQFMANTPRQRKHSKMHVREAYDNLLMPRGATLLPTLSNAAMSAAGLEVVSVTAGQGLVEHAEALEAFLADRGLDRLLVIPSLVTAASEDNGVNPFLA